MPAGKSPRDHLMGDVEKLPKGSRTNLKNASATNLLMGDVSKLPKSSRKLNEQDSASSLGFQQDLTQEGFQQETQEGFQFESNQDDEHGESQSGVSSFVTETSDDDMPIQLSPMKVAKLKHERGKYLSEQQKQAKIQEGLISRNQELHKELLELSRKVNTQLNSKISLSKKDKGSPGKSLLQDNMLFDKHMERMQHDIEGRQKVMDQTKRQVQEYQKQNAELQKHIDESSNKEKLELLREQVLQAKVDLDGLKKKKRALDLATKQRDTELVKIERDMGAYAHDTLTIMDREARNLEERLRAAKKVQKDDDLKLVEQQAKVDENSVIFEDFLKQAAGNPKFTELENEEQLLTLFINLDRDRNKLAKSLKNTVTQVAQEKKTVEVLTKKSEHAAVCLEKEIARLTKIITGQRRQVEQIVERLIADIVNTEDNMYTQEEREDLGMYLLKVQQEMTNLPTVQGHSERVGELVKKRVESIAQKKAERHKAIKDTRSWKQHMSKNSKKFVPIHEENEQILAIEHERSKKLRENRMPIIDVNDAKAKAVARLAALSDRTTAASRAKDILDSGPLSARSEMMSPTPPRDARVSARNSPRVQRTSSVADESHLDKAAEDGHAKAAKDAMMGDVKTLQDKRTKSKGRLVKDQQPRLNEARPGGAPHDEEASKAMLGDIGRLPSKRRESIGKE